MAYSANAVAFDGTNDFLDRGGNLSSGADSKILTFSFWFKRGSTGTTQVIHANSSQRVLIRFQSDNDFEVQCRSSSNSLILTITSTVALTDTGSWHHIAGSFDLSDTAKRHLYIDGVDRLSVGTYTDANIDHTRADHWIGSRFSGQDKYHGDLADVWIDDGQYIDFSVGANLEKFRDSGGCPVDLGSDGATPTGAAPIMFFSGATASWHTNDGAGGGFTENGAIADAASSPSDGCGVGGAVVAEPAMMLGL